MTDHPVCDETGQPLTDAEIAAVIRARPFALMVIRAHHGDHVLVTDGASIVEYGDGVEAGSVKVSRSVITGAMVADRP